MNPKYPIYIVSKGRWDSRLTSKALEAMRVPYHIVVEEREYHEYAKVIDPKKVLVLDERFKREYDTCDDLGDTKGKGPGPARNFIWDDAIKRGSRWHWVMDDNIDGFYRYNRNMKIPVSDGTIFCCMEDFAGRYENVAIVGPNYFMFVARKSKMPPLELNTRIYSCCLIRNDIPYRWRGRYNEDTDLSLRVLKDGWCTVQFNAFLQWKTPTQTMRGGNTDEFYAKEGTEPKTQMLVRLHPDVASVTYRFGRYHHNVDYSAFKVNKLRLRNRIKIPSGANNYGMKLIKKEEEIAKKKSVYKRPGV